MSKDLELAIDAAKAAGKIIKDAYTKAKKIREKGLNDFVTETDLLAEEIIIKKLKPTGYSILGEETGETNNDNDKKWVIDPIDGTANFIRGIPFFAVSIALIENEKELLLGVVYNPILDECYFAEKNNGAFLNENKITINDGIRSDSSKIIFDYNKSENSRNTYAETVKKIMGNKFFSVVTFGASALELCYLSKGSAEAFMSCGDQIYDYAGGLIIAKEAGAEISDWEGKPWNNSSSYILAANPEIKQEVIKYINS